MYMFHTLQIPRMSSVILGTCGNSSLWRSYFFRTTEGAKAFTMHTYRSRLQMQKKCGRDCAKAPTTPVLIV